MNQQNQGQGNSTQPSGNGGGNPAWQEYLKDIPEALHPVVMGAFQKWDSNVTQRFQQIQQEVAPLKQFAPLLQNGVNPDRVMMALRVADEIENNPAEMINRIQTTFNIQPPQSQNTQQTDPLGYDDGNMPSSNQDISQNPVVQQMMQTLQAMQNKFDEEQQQRQQEQELEQFENFLDTAFEGKSHLENNDDARMLVAAFMSQGLNAQDAVNRVDTMYLGQTANSVTEQLTTSNSNGQQPPANDGGLAAFIAAQQGQQTNQQGDNESQAPVVMGATGNAGSGSPAQTLDFASMKNDDVNSVVASLLQADNTN